MSRLSNITGSIAIEAAMILASNLPPTRSVPDYAALVQDVLDPLIPYGAQVALFDFPNYANVGDSAIWLGEEAYLRMRKDLRTRVVDDCSIRHRRLPRLASSVVVLIQGGGNLGDLWIQHQELRETLIGHYREHRIIQLPQSIHFGDVANEDRCRRVFSAHRDFHLLVRDHASLEWGKTLHAGPTYLCPDMALCLGQLPRTSEPRHDIVALLRADKETVTGKASGEHMGNTVIVDWLEEAPSLAQRITETAERLQARYPRRLAPLYGIKRHLYHHLAMERLKRGCAILASGKIVITDRLHAHILCTLMGVPHVVLDNSYRKIGGFRDAWHTGAGLCESATSLSEAHIKAQDLLNAHGATRTA
jgi:pyruvyl transferase EpsO